MSRYQQMLFFARTFLHHPRMLGALTPSSSFVVRRVLQQIDWPQADVIVEYGPGVGTFTGEILRRMRPEARLIAIEASSEFAEFLRQSFEDPRLAVAHGSAADVQQWLARFGYAAADYIISGIPFSMMPGAVRRQILQATFAALRPGGAFLVYQYTRSILPELNRYFGMVAQEREWRNLPPTRLYVSRKELSHELAREPAETSPT